MRTCFFCKSPYQIIEAISITRAIDLDADIYILGVFNGYEEVVEKLRGYNFFKRIIPVHKDVFGSRSKIKLLIQLFQCKEVVSSFLPKDAVYDCLYISSMTHSKLLLKHELEKRNPLMKCVLFEDGMGSYSGNPSVFKRARFRHVFETILGWKSFVPQKTTVMVSYPDFLKLPKELNHVSIEKMPSLEWNTKNQHILLDVFSIAKDSLINERVVIFDVARGIYKNDLDVKVDLLDNCYREILEKFSYNNVIIKAHPRSTTQSVANVKEYKKTGIPVEILYAGMEDLENRVLVGTFSTALFTPKMMFDVEPIVILLYKIVWPGNKSIPETFERIQRVYRHKERLLVPNSIEELKKYIKQL